MLFMYHRQKLSYNKFIKNKVGSVKNEVQKNPPNKLSAGNDHKVAALRIRRNVYKFCLSRTYLLMVGVVRGV